MVTPSTYQFLKGVYPVGVTDLRPYFTQIIGHNSVNVHRIPTKVGTEIRLNEPFKCVKNFSPIRARIRVLWWILRSVRNEEVEEEKKYEEIKTKLCSLVSRNGWSDFLQIWCVDSPSWPARL